MQLFNRPDADHISMITNIGVTLIFVLPIAFFYFKNLYTSLALYSVSVIFVLVLSVSNLKWRGEIDPKIWDDFYSWSGLKRLTKKYIKKSPN